VAGARRAAHADALVNEILTYGYDGIDIDYESLNGASDRDAFSLFFEDLATALHAHGKLLFIAVWRLGGEDLANWSAIAAALRAGEQP
jgi:spore germination protein YaaH